MNSAPEWLRPSAFPRLTACPASGVTSEGCVSSGSDASALGTAWHKVMELRIYYADRLRGLQEIDRIARDLCVDAATLRAWDAAFTWEPPHEAECWIERRWELPVAGVVVAGTADLVLDYPDEDRIEVIDWKSGNPDFADDDQVAQLEPYALAAAQTLGRSHAAVTLHYAQLGDQGWRSPVELDLDEVRERVERTVRRALEQVDLPPEKRRYRTGDSCTFCAGKVRCPALLSAVAPLLAVAGHEPPTLTLENVGSVYERLAVVKRVVKAADESVKALVEAHGSVEIGGGYRLELREVSMPERTLKATTFQRLQRVKAWPTS